MVNYHILEYFRGLSGLSGAQLSDACGKDRKYYSRAIREHTDIPGECVNAMADAVGISSGWITQSPVLYNKQDLDDLIDQHALDEASPLVSKTDKSNQYLIVSQVSAGYLMEFIEKRQEISQEFSPGGVGHAVDRLTELLKSSFLADPDYVKMPLRPMVNYASRRYESVPAFARAFASQCPDVISKSGTEALIRKLMMAPTIPNTTVERKVFESFAAFANVTLDQALNDFHVSSHESVFNLFLTASIFVSGWTMSEGDDGFVLTLTNPKYLPSSKAAETVPTMSDFPAGFKL
jgi:hypothetical protein